MFLNTPLSVFVSNFQMAEFLLFEPVHDKNNNLG